MNGLLIAMLIFTIVDITAGGALAILLTASNGSRLMKLLSWVFIGLVVREILGYGVSAQNNEALTVVGKTSLVVYSSGRAVQSLTLCLLVGYLFFRKKEGKIVHVNEVHKDDLPNNNIITQ